MSNIQLIKNKVASVFGHLVSPWIVYGFVIVLFSFIINVGFVAQVTKTDDSSPLETKPASIVAGILTVGNVLIVLASSLLYRSDKHNVAVYSFIHVVISIGISLLTGYLAVLYLERKGYICTSETFPATNQLAYSLITFGVGISYATMITWDQDT